jgi:hypothetical protein
MDEDGSLLFNVRDSISILFHCRRRLQVEESQHMFLLRGYVVAIHIAVICLIMTRDFVQQFSTSRRRVLRGTGLEANFQLTIQSALLGFSRLAWREKAEKVVANTDSANWD